MEIKSLPLDSIVGYEKNYRTTSAKGVEALKRSIEAVGFVVPIVLDKNNVIIAGHLRLAVAKEMGMEEVPCVFAENLTEDQVKKLRYLDNEVHKLSTWDQSLLEDEKRWLEIMSDGADWGWLSGLFGDQEVKSFRIDDVAVTDESISKTRSEIQDLFTQRATARTITTEEGSGGKMVASHRCPNCNKDIFTGIQ